ncbi:MAG: DUF1801 domain-containing protein [Bacteroidetes bacterium]|nr:DUF1801 domain-containing protein [Bacteroidota bacterium]
MQIKADTPEQYIDQLPEERKIAISKLRQTILDNLPEGFAETMSYGMIGYVVPLSVYPAGYRCDPKLPLPFMNIASQKSHIVVHHLGLYGSKDLLDWFTNEYTKNVKGKPDIGKGCIRFKKPDQIPFQLIGELTAKMNVAEWIKIYESNFKH